MMLRPYFQTRAFAALANRPELLYRVNTMQWAAQAGCVEASITAFGPVLDLWEMIEFLRCPVTIRDEMGVNAWWGYVSEVRVRVGALEIGVTLESMQNAVAVAYSYVAPGTSTVGQRKTTDWAVDADSAAEYGRKEFLSSQGGLSDAAATARRDAILASRKYPQGTVNPFGMLPRGSVGYSGAENSQSATIVCRGWWRTLGWRYASVASTANTVTTAQITSLVSTYGQFFTATDVEAASGISSSAYRTGDRTALDEVIDLLNSGGAGGRRLLASVDVDRRLQVWEEPASTSVGYVLKGKDGALLTKEQYPVRPYLPPVGVWCRLTDIIPATADVTKMIDPTLQFIEGATWSNENGLVLQFRGQPSIEDMLMVMR